MGLLGQTIWHVMRAPGCRKALADWAQAAVLDTGNQSVTSIDWAPGRLRLPDKSLRS